MAERSTIGRPRKFRTPKEMERHILQYLKENDGKLTLTGLANHVGINRNTLLDYEGREEFAGVIKGARSLIEQRVEELLLYSKQGQAGLIFWLKNAGWQDKTEIEVNDISKLSNDELADKLSTNHQAHAGGKAKVASIRPATPPAQKVATGK
jgi:hypothetical protein